MTPHRISLAFLIVAALAGAGDSGLGLASDWSTGLRILCVGALAGFLVSFLVGLDRSSLVRR